MIRVVIIAALVLSTACSADMWIPLQTAPRSPVSYEHLQTAPDRPYLEIGIITPPEDEYETEAVMVKALRKEAARHGADAIFIETQDEKQGWHFDVGRFGGSGGSGTLTRVRAKAIVWRDSPAS